MSVTIIQGSEVIRPDTVPFKSSVLDHATVKDNENEFGRRNDAGLWPSYNCLDVLVPTSICPDPEADPKTFASAGWIPAFTFPVYGGVQCSAVGLDKADMKSEIDRVFRLAEGKGIERSLLLNRFVASDSDLATMNGQAVSWDAPVDVTPATDVSLATALALLEGYAASVYTGVPTIHMPRAAASLLGDRIVWEGDLAYTRLGSKVAIGGGYDPVLGDGETFEGSWDLYATGEVYVERGPGLNVQSYVLPGDGSGDRGLDDNTVIAIAERMFRVGVDCFVAKATGTVAPIAQGGFGN